MDSDQNVLQALAQAFSVSNWKSRTEAEQKASDVLINKGRTGVKSDQDQAHSDAVTEISRYYERNKSIPGDLVAKAIKEKALTPQQAQELTRDLRLPTLVRQTKHMSLEEMAQVMPLTSPKERAQVYEHWMKLVEGRNKQVAAGRNAHPVTPEMQNIGPATPVGSLHGWLPVE
jgi:hypothetical protein